MGFIMAGISNDKAKPTFTKKAFTEFVIIVGCPVEVNEGPAYFTTMIQGSLQFVVA
jgi:hypothetical protein